jgi:hypothetical protein
MTLSSRITIWYGWPLKFFSSSHCSKVIRLFICKQNAFLKFCERDIPPKKYFSSTRLPKDTSLGQFALFEPLCVKIGSVVWSAGTYNKNKGKLGSKSKEKYIYLYLTYVGSRPQPPIVNILGKFGGLGNSVNCAKFYDDRSRGFSWVLA